jgi:hypothetical protein
LGIWLARWTALPVVPLEEFVRAHDRFDVYSLGSDWVMTSLSRTGGTLSELGKDEYGTLYEFRTK